MAESRTLINFQPLPPRKRALDRAQVDKDIREALAKAESRLIDQSRHLGVTGWRIDVDYGSDGFDYGIVNHTVVGRLRLVRPN